MYVPWALIKERLSSVSERVAEKPLRGFPVVEPGFTRIFRCFLTTAAEYPAGSSSYLRSSVQDVVLVPWHPFRRLAASSRAGR